MIENPFLVILIFPVFFVPAVFLVLKHYKVTDQLISRSIFMSLAFVSLQFVVPLLGARYFGLIGILAGGVIGMLLSYALVASVLAISNFERVMITLGIPFVVFLIFSPLMWMFYVLAGGLML